MVYAVAVATQQVAESFVPVSHVDRLPGVVIRVETDLGPRKAKRIGRYRAKYEQAIYDPKVVGVRLICRS